MTIVLSCHCDGLVTKLCSTCDPMYCSLPGSSVHVDSLGKNTGVGWEDPLEKELPTHSSILA